jgi:hypothetical protein
MENTNVPKFMQILDWRTIFDRNGRLRISGRVFGNPKFTDGSYIETSPVITLTYLGDYHMVQTQNSVYLLK